MNKYIIKTHVPSTVVYTYIVDAENLQKAQELIKSLDANDCDTLTDLQDEKIISIELIESV